MNLTPKEIAARLDTDPKTFRRFLRTLITDPAQRPGKGRKWSIDEGAFDALADAFANYSNRTARTITIDDLTDDDA